MTLLPMPHVDHVTRAPGSPPTPGNHGSASSRNRGSRGTSVDAMVHYASGDILSADAEGIVNPVNCVGVMGRGLAAAFKRAYPDNFSVYEAACRRREVVPGCMLVVETGQLTNPRFIINFPTKQHWRTGSRIEDIEAGLASLVTEVTSRKIASLAIPPLGCGLGGLEWDDVRPRIVRAFADVSDTRVIVYKDRGSER